MFFKKTLQALAAAAALLLPVAASAAGQLAAPPEVYQEIEIKPVQSGPVLQFSDSPEMVYGTGILYRDWIKDRARIFFHHVNATSTPKKLAVVLKNSKSMRPVKYRITRQGVAGRSVDYLRDGKEAERLYFDDASQKGEEGSVGFSRSAEVLSGRGEVLRSDKLLTGIVDIEVDRPVQVSVLMCDPRQDIEYFNDTAPVEPMDEHPLRGTFTGADWNYKVPVVLDSDSRKPYMLEQASSGQGFIIGVDSTTGKMAENYGNYGIIYNIDFTVAGSRPMQFIFNPIGGPFAGYGVLEGNGRRQLIAMPQNRVDIGYYVNDAIVLAELEPGDYRFTWSPPGASNLPVRFFWRGADKQ